MRAITWATTALLTGISLTARGEPPADAPAPPTPPPGDSAQPAESPQQVEYEQHMDNGVKLFRGGDAPAALAEFEAAYRASPKASPLINQALCYKKLRRYADAIAALDRALADHADTLDERHRAAAEKEVNELRALVAWVVVTLSPREAHLRIDAEGGEYEPRREPDGSVPLAPGPNRLRATADGFKPVVQTVTLVAGRANAPVELALVPDAKSPPPELKHAPARPEPPRAEPTYRGFYAVASAAILTLANNATGFARNDAAQAGYALGLAGGYRLAKWAAFEGFAQYNDVRIHGVFDGHSADNQQFVVRGGRFGIGLRVMAPGDKWIRFVTVLGAGAAIDNITYKNAPDVALYATHTGVDAFGQLDLNLEMELSHILIDIGAQATAESSKHWGNDDGSNAFREHPLLFVGPKVQIGYAFW